MRVGIVGAGYVGLVSGVVLAELGHDVLLVERDDRRRALLARNEIPFHEPGLAEALASQVHEGRVRIIDAVASVTDTDLALLCVPTPIGPEGRMDTSALEAVVDAIAAAATALSTLRFVLVRSTVLPGTTRRLAARAPRLVFGALPEFLREGAALADQRAPDRLVVGSESTELRNGVARLYASIAAPRFETTAETAELLKLANNALLSTCISFSNEIARIAETLEGVDADVVFAGVHLDRRLSSERRAGITEYLKPGAGFGGSCLGKDLASLASFARDRGEVPSMLDAAHAVNEGQPHRLVDRLMAALRGISAPRVLVLGLAFKSGTDDVRDTVAIPVVRSLAGLGVDVLVHDPLATDAFLGSLGDVGPRVAAVEDWRGAIASADAVVVLTRETSYALDLPPALGAAVRVRAVVDGRSVLRGAHLPDGMRYIAVGLGPDAGPSEGDGGR